MTVVMPVISWGRVSEDREFRKPERATDHAAAHDLYLPETIAISPGETLKVPLNLVCRMPINFRAKINVRSGVGTKYNVVLANGTGIVDSDYYDEWCLFLHKPLLNNDESADPDNRKKSHYYDGGFHFEFKQGERIAQVCFEEVPEYREDPNIYTAQEIKDMVLARGSTRRGGFGSTGK